MPSRQLNRRLWTGYDWSSDGEEWSKNWGNTSNLWYGTLMPRLSAWLGDVRVVEIGPGHGRLTEYLRNYCTSLILVDVVPNCIEFCRQRFGTANNLEFAVNDGSSLAFLPDASVDLVFSFDSLVHADREVITAYLTEIERVLRVGARAMLHHSNLGAVLESAPDLECRADLHMRDRDVSAELVRQATSHLSSLRCRMQELISWDDSLQLIDCISTFEKSEASSQEICKIIPNPEFYLRARELCNVSDMYHCATKDIGSTDKL